MNLDASWSAKYRCQHNIYLRNQLLAFKKGQRKHPEMLYLAREMTERAIDELVVCYSTLPPPCPKTPDPGGMANRPSQVFRWGASLNRADWRAA